MSEVKVISEDNYVEFSALLPREALEGVLEPYNGSDQYHAMLRYYTSCIETQGTPLMRTPLALLKQGLASLQGSGRRRRAPNSKPAPDSTGVGLTEVHEKIDNYETRYNLGLALLEQPLIEVPRKLHFVWLGGGLGGIQLDYLRVWKRIMPDDFSVSVWHDPDGLLVYETNRIIVEAARADVWFRNPDTQPSDLAIDMYVKPVAALKREAFLHVQRATERGESADEARIDLLVRAYGKDEATLRALRETNAKIMAKLPEEGIQLGNLHELPSFDRLKRFYDRELSLRGNLATASDIARVLVEYDEGGTYNDIDFLPPLSNTIAGVDVGKLDGNRRLGVLQLLLNENSEWMPARGTLSEQHSSYVEHVPDDLSELIKAFAKSKPSMREVFVPIENRYVQPDSLRLAMINGKESNALFISHPKSAMLEAVIERFQIHLDALEAVELKAFERNVDLYDAETLQLAESLLKKDYGIFDYKAGDIDSRASQLCSAIISYFHDGVEPVSQFSVALTGPAAVRAALLEYESTRLTPESAENIRSAIQLMSGFNDATEEEKVHSWVEGSSIEGWLKDQKTLWDSGKLKARYKGDISELLKRQSVLFDKGWPVIEGRHVYSTDVLQLLADGLGKPFLTAMESSHTGELTFDQPIPLGFDERESIRSLRANARLPGLQRDPQTQLQSIPELLNLLAKGHVDVLELGPLQCLQLGALIGAKALDNSSLDGVRPELDNLINNFSKPGTIGGYATLERALYQHQAPAFMDGLASAVEYSPRHGETALGLKKVALEQPLTLRQWGHYVARVQQTAKLEHRSAIVERLGTVLGSFEGGTVSFVPQDLLLQGGGDGLGGRCYPLALAMAAAYSQGQDAVDTLRTRFFLQVLEPEASDSKAFLSSIESLHDVQLEDVGKMLARSDLNEVVDILEASDTTATLMLNSDNHAMLVAKTFVGKAGTYHFYDPNFGLFSIRNATGFKQALQTFFLEHGMARFYAAYGDAVRPTFDLIELDGARVSDVSLPGAIKVSRLLQSGALPGEGKRPARQRMASARGRSLQDNPRLGRSLLALDGHWWAQQIADTTTHLLRLHQLAPDLVPLFDTLEITPDGTYRMSMVDPAHPEALVRISTADHRLLQIKTYVSERFTELANHPAALNDPTAAGSVHTLNAGFAIQALMNGLRSREGEGRNLTMAVRLHAYVNYAQLTHGVLTDITEVVGLVRQGLAQEKLIAVTVAPVVKASVGASVSEATGGLLQLANVGFDIYQLASTDNDVERAKLGTQLAFDSASLALSVGAYAAGATVAGAFLGGASVLLGGLAVGVSALVEGFATIAEDAKQVGQFFDEVATGHLQAYRRYADHGAWVPRPSLIVQTVDLANHNLVLDSPKLYPLHDRFGVPTFYLDYQRAIDIRRELDLPDSVTFAPPVGQAIVLPCTPQSCYGYEYKALPFASLRNDTGFATARRLEKKKADGGWLFLFSFYSFPSEQIVHRLREPDYRPTTINVVLDLNDRSLIVPHLPSAWHGKITYRVQGAGKRCALLLNPGVSLVLDTALNRNSSWVLDASWAEEGDIKIERDGKLSIGDVRVVLSGRGRHDILLRIANEQVLQVDLDKQQLILAEQRVPSGIDQHALQTHLQGLAQQHRLVVPYTPIHHYLVPFESPQEPQYVTAWYDAKEDRFLYIRDDEPGTEAVVLGAVVGDDAWFYDPQDIDIWQVDATTGLLSVRYMLWGPRVLGSVTATTKTVEADEHGLIHVTQQVTRQDGKTDLLAYVIHDGHVSLTSVTRGLDSKLESLLGASDFLEDWSLVLGEGHILPASIGKLFSYDVVSWQPAPFVSICWKREADDRDMAWVRQKDGLIISPATRPKHFRSWPDSIKNMTDLVLLAPEGDGELFAIFDRRSKALVRRERTVVEGKGQWSTRWMQTGHLKEVFTTASGYVALTFEGLLFNVTANATLALAGVNEHWFKDRVDWCSALEPLARQYETERLALVGLTNVGAAAKLCAWYIDNKLLLAELEHATEVRLLNVTPDGDAAWLFDVSSGEVYRQALIDTQKLKGLFGQGSQLLGADTLPVVEREWAPWTFTELAEDGPGLRGVTSEGLVLLLREHQPALITGVTKAWVVAQDGLEHEGLERLARSLFHSPLLTVEEPDHLKWFIAQTGRVIRIPKSMLPNAFEVLGTQRQTNVLVHEAENEKVLTVPLPGHVSALGYIQREGEVLVIEGHANMSIDLQAVIPEGVTTLVLSIGQGAMTYQLSKAAWLRTQSVILDCRQSLGDAARNPGKLIWELAEPDQLILSKADEHLVIIDPNSQHSVIIRDAYATDGSLRGEAWLSFGGDRHYSASVLAASLNTLPSPQDGTALKDLLEGLNATQTNQVS